MEIQKFPNLEKRWRPVFVEKKKNGVETEAYVAQQTLKTKGIGNHNSFQRPWAPMHDIQLSTILKMMA